MTILVIGFEPTAQQDSASAAVISAAFEQHEKDWGTRVLHALLHVEKGTTPDMHQRQSQQLVQLIFEHRPRVLLFVGQAAGRSKLMLERIGINYFIDQCIVDEAPAAYWQSLPHLDDLATAAEQGKVALGISNFAGTSLTNHLLYSALHLSTTENLPIQIGLLHLPLLDSQCVDELKGQPCISLDTARDCLIWLVNTLLGPTSQDSGQPTIIE